jgi:hypothetical protein
MRWPISPFDPDLNGMWTRQEGLISGRTAEGGPEMPESSGDAV